MNAPVEYEEAGPSWKAWVVGAAALSLLFGGYWYMNSEKAPTRAKKPPVPIRVSAVERRDMAVVEHTLGTVVPFTTVQIASRVSGVITNTYFQEGQMVKKGDLLFEIDPRPYKAAFDNAVATESNARSKADRMRRLFQENAVGAQDNSDAQTAYAVAQSQAEMARLNLEFTKIRSPVDGKTGAMLVQQGNTVIANMTTTPLVTIAQIRPIKVSFALPQSDLPRIQARQKTNGLIATVDFQDQDGHAIQTDGPALSAPVDFINNTVNNVSGTIEMRTVFPNADDTLVPGQLVNVTVQLNDIPDALVVPHDAVNIGPDGNFVFVIEDEKAVTRPITVLFDNGKSTAITGDIKPGDQVVIEGQLRLTPGSTVAIEGALERPVKGEGKGKGKGKRGAAKEG